MQLDGNQYDLSFEQMVKEHDRISLAEIKRLQEEINSGDTSCSKYYELFIYQSGLQDAEKKYKAIIDTYARNTINAGINEIEKNSADVKTYIYMAEVYKYTKDLKLALSYYNKAVEQFPDSDCGYLSRGIFYYENDDKDLAELDFKKAIELNTENTEYIEDLKYADKISEETDKLLANTDELIAGLRVLNIIQWFLVIVVVYAILQGFMHFFQ